MPDPSRRALGNYLLGPLLGQGGMGAVYAGEHRFLGDRVAIKLLHPHLTRDEAQAARFLREATATRAIQHPQVVRVLDFGQAEDDGALYLVMERIEGETLEARLARGRLDEAEARRLGAQLADGLAAAHALGVVHRDLKPANILLGPDGAPTIVDFGIAKLLGAGATGGGALGTFEYTAPEQLGRGVVGPHSDVYALGVVLFETATGALPFESAGQGACPQLFETPRRPSSLAPVTADFEALILDCLALEPARRPRSMAEVRDRLRGLALERATQPLGDPERPAALAPKPAIATSRAQRRNRFVAILAAAILLAALGLWRLLARAPAAAPTRSARVSSPKKPAAIAPEERPSVAAPPPASVVVTPPVVVTPATRRAVKPHRRSAPRSPVYHQPLD